MIPQSGQGERSQGENNKNANSTPVGEELHQRHLHFSPRQNESLAEAVTEETVSPRRSRKVIPPRYQLTL